MEPILGILLGGFLGFNLLATPGRAEKAAEKALQKQFPGALVNVEIKGKRGRDVLNGRFKSVRVEVANFTLAQLPVAGASLQSPNTDESRAPQPSKPGKIGQTAHLEIALRDVVFNDTRFDHLNLSMDAVRYDLSALKKDGQLRLISFANGRVALGVRAPSLVPTLVERAPETASPGVRLQNGEAIFSGLRSVLGAQTPVEIRGQVVARGPNLELDDAKVRVAGLALPPLVARPILQKVNPLYRVDPEDRWPFRVELDKVKAENDLLEVEGALAMR